nr:glycosyltransferase [Saprospiraceae bacterium]
MRILFIVENYHPKVGGLEKLFKTLADRLAAEGWNVTILTNGSGLALPWRQLEAGSTVYRLPFLNRYFFTFLAFVPAFFLARKCDLIHTTSYNAALPAWMASKLSGKKCIITFHEVWDELWLKLPFFPRWKLFFLSVFERLVLSLSFDRFIAPSR